MRTEIEYIILHKQDYALSEALTDEEVVEFFRNEMKYLYTGEKPTYENRGAQLFHLTVWGRMEQVLRKKQTKKQYDAERYNNKKKKTEE